MITGNFGSVPLVHIGHDTQGAKHQLGTFVTSLATIFSFNMTGRVAMSISEAFFFAATSRYSEKQLLCFSSLQLFNL